MAARSLNKVMIIGNLTRDVELRYTANGTAIATFGVATNREYVPSNSNESVEETQFHNIVAWSKLAELCDKLLAKGQKVYIEGRLQTRDWVDNDTNKKLYRTEIIAEEMIVLGGGKNNPSDETVKGSSAEGEGESMGTSAEMATPEDSGDVPF
jgi:single-strand DNA-binding protein